MVNACVFENYLVSLELVALFDCGTPCAFHKSIYQCIIYKNNVIFKMVSEKQHYQFYIPRGGANKQKLVRSKVQNIQQIAVRISLSFSNVVISM